MWYAITGIDTPDSLEKRLQARPAHLDRLHALKNTGRLLLAGPFPVIDNEDPGSAGFSGSLIVAEWADADPYMAAGVYASVTVKPFKKVLP